MIHFFTKNNSSDGNWHDMELSAWSESKDVLYIDNNELGSSFKRVEHLRLFTQREANKSVSFKADFGENTAIGSRARSVKELIKSETDNSNWSGPGSEHATEKEYLALRGKLIELYKKNMFLDLETIKLHKKPFKSHQ